MDEKRAPLRRNVKASLITDRLFLRFAAKILLMGGNGLLVGLIRVHASYGIAGEEPSRL